METLLNEKVILIDNREKDSGIPELLKEKGIPILFENLEIGDLIIERKTSKDLLLQYLMEEFFNKQIK